MIDFGLMLRQPGRVPAAVVGRSRATAHGAIDRILAPWVDPGAGVLINGFWRSGTTWLLQSVAARCSAKSVFEPLSPRVGLIHDGVRHGGPRDRGPAPALFMPYCPEASALQGDLLTAARAALRASVGGPWVRRARASVSEAFRRRVVVKLVLGHFCFLAWCEAFGIPAIHVWRDPRAVAASVMRAGWWSGWLEELSLKQQLLEPTDGRSDFFRQYEDVMAQFDRQGALARLTAFWCLCELFVARTAERSTARLGVLSYREMVLDPSVVDRLLAELGLGPSAGTVTGASPTTGPKRLELSAEQRIDGWRSELSVEQVATVESVVSSFDLTERLT